MRWPLIAVVSIVTAGCAARVHPTPPPPQPVRLSFTATAYCTGRVTATGAAPTRTTVAADPAVLPLGTRISVSGLGERYNGVYLVMDTGSKIHGRRIDLYMHDCREAVRFGHRSALVSIVR